MNGHADKQLTERNDKHNIQFRQIFVTVALAATSCPYGTVCEIFCLVIVKVFD